MEATGDEPRNEDESDEGAVVERLRRACRWLRDLHRGYAYTGHLPRRRE